MNDHKNYVLHGSMFYNRKGELTSYSLACGYIQTWISNDKPTRLRNVTLKLYHDGGSVYHVRAHDHEKVGRIFWETFDTLTEARKFYSASKKTLRLAI